MKRWLWGVLIIAAIAIAIIPGAEGWRSGTVSSPPQAISSPSIGGGGFSSGPLRPVVVASKPFGESFLLAEMFAQLLESREAWLRACGLHVVGETGRAEHLQTVHELAGSDDPIVEETARWAARRLA